MTERFTKLDPVKIALLHAKVEAGEIDIGPKPVHEPTGRDMRDLRDPGELGKRLTMFPDVAPTLRGVADSGLYEIENCPKYDGSESSVTQTVRDYQQELQTRAATGDKYAISMLAGEAFVEGNEE
jgi:hypothetical protein